MTRPSVAEIDRFLSGYGFADDVIVERIDIEKNGIFEFYLFAAWDAKTIASARVDQTVSTHFMSPFHVFPI